MVRGSTLADNRVTRIVRADLSEDAWLRYVLLLSGLLCGFWFWYRVPNFAGADEYSRLLHPMKGAGYAIADPGIDGLQRGLTDGRGLGATFYIYGVVLVPLFVFVVLTGQMGEFSSLAGIESRWELWHEVPAWFWTGGILLGRLVVIALAVGSVYLTYRIGTVLRNRRTGRYAAALFTVTFGLVSMAHEAGEDVPMLFTFLLTSYCALRYVQTGDRRLFLAGCVLGGLTIALKLTGGTAVFVLAAAYLVRAYQEQSFDSVRFLRPRLLGTGVLLGIVAIYVGFPSILVGGPEHLVNRVVRETGRKASPTNIQSRPVLYWIIEGYLKAFGAPLAIATLGGAVGTAWTFREDKVDTAGVCVLSVIPVVYIAVYSQWSFVRMRHLLPTIPILLLLLAITLVSLEARRGTVARAILAVVLLSSATFAGAGTVQYASDPRDQASTWMSVHVGENETVEVYESSITDVGVVHGQPLQHYSYDEENATQNASLVLNDTAYTEWMTSMPERRPEYIQLTWSEVRYADPSDPRSRRYPERAAYVRDLLAEGGEYHVVAEFGERPSEQHTGIRGIVQKGLRPSPDQRAQYIVFLERSNRTT